MLSLCTWTQRCYGRHNVSRKSVTTRGLSILMHGVILLPEATSAYDNIQLLTNVEVDMVCY